MKGSLFVFQIRIYTERLFDVICVSPVYKKEKKTVLVFMNEQNNEFLKGLFFKI